MGGGEARRTQQLRTTTPQPLTTRGYYAPTQWICPREGGYGAHVPTPHHGPALTTVARSPASFPHGQVELERLRRKAEEEALKQRQHAAELQAAMAAHRSAAAAAAAAGGAGPGVPSTSYGSDGGGAGANGEPSAAVQAQLRRTLKVGAGQHVLAWPEQGWGHESRWLL